MGQINAGLIGNGMAAKVFHLPVIASISGLKLKKIVARHMDAAGAVSPEVEAVPDVAALLRDEEIELVVIATPNSSHFDLARQSLLADKHVVVEKPFTITSDQAQKLIDLAHKRNRLITVYQNRRWDGDFLTVRKLLNEKLLGQLVEYESHFDRFRKIPRTGAWREEAGEGSGVLFDLGPHLIDQALILFGLPQMVTADVRTERENAKTDDSFELLLHYDNLKVTLKASMLAQGPCQRFILRGTDGSFVKCGLDPQEEALKQGQRPSMPGWGEEPQEQWGRLITQVNGLSVETPVETRKGCYGAFYQNLVDAIAGRAELAVKPEQALDTIRIIEMAKQSSEQKRTVAVI
jgi:scyllo-inositol 2-dehydrogenase (NADP+)